MYYDTIGPWEIVIGGFENVSDSEGATTLLSQRVVHVSPPVQRQIAISQN